MGIAMRTGLLILVLIALIAGGLYWSENVGLTDLGGILKPWAASVPGLGSYFKEPSNLSPEELRTEDFLRREASLQDLLAQIEKEKQQLKGIQEELNREKERLSYWEEELERREQAFQERENQFEDREARYQRFAAIYSGMRPVDAAAILETLDDLLVIEIFNRMENRNISAVLREMDPEVAGTIMRKMSR